MRGTCRTIIVATAAALLLKLGAAIPALLLPATPPRHTPIPD